jgi:hypothetical protein
LEIEIRLTFDLSDLLAMVDQARAAIASDNLLIQLSPLHGGSIRADRQKREGQRELTSGVAAIHRAMPSGVAAIHRAMPPGVAAIHCAMLLSVAAIHRTKTVFQIAMQKRPGRHCHGGSVSQRAHASWQMTRRTDDQRNPGDLLGCRLDRLNDITDLVRMMLTGLAPNRKVFAIVPNQVVIRFAQPLPGPPHNRVRIVRQVVRSDKDLSTLAKLIDGRFTNARFVFTRGCSCEFAPRIGFKVNDTIITTIDRVV